MSLPNSPPHSSTLQAVTSRDLIDWCAARLAHYKVPSAVHLLPRMPTTGSGKILKTELRRMFSSGGATPAAAAADAGSAKRGGAAAAPAAGLAEAAAVLAAACGGCLACQALDAGLGVEWGRELLPDLTYLLAVDQADKLAAQASADVAGTLFPVSAGLPAHPGLRGHACCCVLETVPCALSCVRLTGLTGMSNRSAMWLLAAAALAGGSCSEQQGCAQPGGGLP